jgi:purine catabolism regulator
MSDRGMAGSAIGRTLTVEELLSDEVLAGAELLGGRSGLGHAIAAVNVMTVPEIGRWVRRDEFLLASGYPLPRDDRGQAELLSGLHASGLAGIGVKLDRYLPDLGQEIATTADALGLPLIVIPERIRFDDILTRAFSTIVNRQAAALARAQEIHHAFLSVTLSGGGLQELAQELSGLLDGAGVTVTDPQGVVLTTAGPRNALVEHGLLEADRVDVSRLAAGPQPGGGARAGGRWAARAIRAGELHHGFVVAAEAEPRGGEFSLVAVDQAAIVAALEISRDLAVTAAEQRFSSNALYQLITGTESESSDATVRGRGFGWDLQRDVVVLVGRREPEDRDRELSERQQRLADERAIESWTSAVRGVDRTAAAAGLGAELVAVLGADRDAAASARAVQTDLARFARARYAIGVSRVHPGPAGISGAYQEARVALRLGHRVSGPGAVTRYQALGLFRLLDQIGEDELRGFAEEILGPLTRLAEPERSEMLRTLETLVEHNMNMAQAARRLHFHYNTLRYRLAKLERLLGPFSTSTTAATQVCVALQIRQLQSHTAPRAGG